MPQFRVAIRRLGWSIGIIEDARFGSEETDEVMLSSSGEPMGLKLDDLDHEFMREIIRIAGMHADGLTALPVRDGYLLTTKAGTVADL